MRNGSLNLMFLLKVLSLLLFVFFAESKPVYSMENKCIELVKKHGWQSAKINNTPSIAHSNWQLKKVKKSWFFEKDKRVAYIYTLRSGRHDHKVLCKVYEAGYITLDIYDYYISYWGPYCDNMGVMKEC